MFIGKAEDNSTGLIRCAERFDQLPLEYLTGFDAGNLIGKGIITAYDHAAAVIRSIIFNKNNVETQFPGSGISQSGHPVVNRQCVITFSQIGFQSIISLLVQQSIDDVLQTIVNGNHRRSPQYPALITIDEDIGYGPVEGAIGIGIHFVPSIVSGMAVWIVISGIAYFDIPVILGDDDPLPVEGFDLTQGLQSPEIIFQLRIGCIDKCFQQDCRAAIAGFIPGIEQIIPRQIVTTAQQCRDQYIFKK